MGAASCTSHVLPSIYCSIFKLKAIQKTMHVYQFVIVEINMAKDDIIGEKIITCLTTANTAKNAGQVQPTLRVPTKVEFMSESILRAKKYNGNRSVQFSL